MCVQVHISVSEPRWALQMCHNTCRAKGFKFFDIAAHVAEEGGAAHTINLCRNCHNERRVKQGKAEVNGVNSMAMTGQKSSRGKLWVAFGVEQFLCRM